VFFISHTKLQKVKSRCHENFMESKAKNKKTREKATETKQNKKTNASKNFPSYQ